MLVLRFGYESISMAILPLLLIQELRLSANGERKCIPPIGSLPRSSVVGTNEPCYEKTGFLHMRK